MIRVVNIVLTFRLIPVKFSTVSKEFAVLACRRFRAIFIRFGKVSLQLFENGTANITGITTQEEGLYYIAGFCLKVGTSIVSWKTTSITATAKLEYNFEKLKRHPEAEYEPELYPAIYFTLSECKAVVYHTGKINFVGIKCLDHVDEMFNEIKSKILDSYAFCHECSRTKVETLDSS